LQLGLLAQFFCEVSWSFTLAPNRTDGRQSTCRCEATPFLWPFIRRHYFPMGAEAWSGQLRSASGIVNLLAMKLLGPPTAEGSCGNLRGWQGCHQSPKSDYWL